MDLRKVAILVSIVGLIGVFILFDLGQFLTLETLKARQTRLQAYAQANPLSSGSLFFLFYTTVIAVSIPGAAVMTLAAGAIFGLLWGVLIVSFASSVGATLAFLMSRYVLRGMVEAKFGASLKTINDGISRDGPFYLFTLRLIPLVPFVVINLAMGLTGMKTRVFYLVSQAGMLAATIVFVNAGTQLAKLDSLAGILSPALLGSFALLAVFPFVARSLMESLNVRKIYRGHVRPSHYDRNVVVIGAGSAGLVASYIAAALKARVTLVERDRMGGDCLYTGCVPSKALLRTAKFLSHVNRAKEFGVDTASAVFDFATVMDRVQSVISKIEPHDSVERYTALGVECISGTARITTPFSVEINGTTLTTRSIIVATGAAPFVPPIPGISDMGYWTSDTIWSLREKPKRLMVLGGGPIGCELSQAFARLGCSVTQLEMAPRLLMREDGEISAMLLERFLHEGIDCRLNHKATEFRIVDGRKVALCERLGEQADLAGDEPTEVQIEFDELLVAVGRKPNSADFGLAELGIPLNRNGTVTTNAFMQTRFPNIYACGDVAGPYQFTHVAAHQAWYASVNALFSGLKKFKADYSVIPWATFTEPEIARVGLNECDAIKQGVPYEVTTYGLDDLDRAIADQEAHGLVKVLTKPGKDRILGATIVGEHAGDLITEFVTAMRNGIGLNKILGTIHIYPTLAEANKYAAGNWKRAHAPTGLLRLVERYHRWRRGGDKPVG